MKKTIKTVLLLVIPVITISCGKHSDKKHRDSETEQTKDHHQKNEDTLKLDNGKLWSANAETTEGINNMITLMNRFSEKENLKAYTTLKQGLEKEFGTIITKCTMTGEAHNQLHTYLIPMKELFNGLGSSDLNTCKTNFDKLNSYLTEYSTYFE
ncbi:MAG: hypothetical protein Q8J84_09825 [Flavobacteriaceae bacterium]|nr:hypothetical protein [Flavobacteriaceae bacterium]